MKSLKGGENNMKGMSLHENITGRHYGLLVQNQETGLREILKNTNIEFQNKFWIEPDRFNDKKVLDIACGTGRFSNLFSNYGASKVVGIDISEGSIKTAIQRKKSNTEFYLVSIYNFNRNEKFDMVFAIGCLMHMRDPEHAFQKLSKYVKEGGMAAVWVYEKQNRIKEMNTLLLRKLTTKLPYSVLGKLSSMIQSVYKSHRTASLLNIFVNLSGRKIDNMDTLGVPYYARFTENQVKSWFMKNGFRDIKTTYLSLNVGIKAMIHGKHGGGFGMKGIKDVSTRK